jgi:hypothetical protein
MTSNLPETTINIYPDLMHEEDLTPDCGVEIDAICEEIHGAVEGWGCDKSRLVAALGSTTPEDRLKICLRYKDIYEKDLKSVMKKEVSGDLGTVLKYLALSPVEAECAMIKAACKGVGAHRGILYSILCGRSNKDMELLKKTYYKCYTKDLTALLLSELRGDLEKLVSACLQASEEPFDPDYHTLDKAKEDAEEIWKKGQGKFFGTNESKLFKVIVLSPPKYLKMVNDAYAEEYGYTLIKAMEKELGGKSEDAAIFALKMRFKPYDAVAGIIKKACAGIGTDEDLLTSCIVRYQDLMAHVNLAHEELYGKSVHDRVRSECGGQYKEVLLALLNKTCPEE